MPATARYVTEVAMAEQAIFMYFSGLTPLAVPFQRGHNALNPRSWIFLSMIW
ncbi:transposase, partial [Yersinia pestis]